MRCGEQSPSPHPAPGGLTPQRGPSGTCPTGPWPASRAPACGHHPQGGLVPLPHRSLSRGTWARPPCPAWGGARSTRSPSWPTTRTGPEATLCPCATPPVGGPWLCGAVTARGTPGAPTPRARTADRQFPRSLPLRPGRWGPRASLGPRGSCSWGGQGPGSPGLTCAHQVLRPQGSGGRGAALWSWEGGPRGGGGRGANFQPSSLSPTPSGSRSPPSDLALVSESPDSLRVSWTPPAGHVLHYWLTYALASGSGPEHSVGLSGARPVAPRGPWGPGGGGGGAAGDVPCLSAGRGTARKVPRGWVSRGARAGGSGGWAPRSPSRDPGAT